MCKPLLMALANSGSTEELLAAFFYGREDIIPEMFRRLLNTLYDAKHDSDRFSHFSITSSQLVLPCSASLWSRLRRLRKLSLSRRSHRSVSVGSLPRGIRRLISPR
jgi:hypothetical protein